MKDKTWKITLFTHKERTGVLVLVLLLIMMQMIRHLTQQKVRDVDVKMAIADNLVDLEHINESGQPTKERNHSFHKSMRAEKRKRGNMHPVYFDPNTANDETWSSWGLRPKTIQTIRRYQQKGGRFRRSEDLYKIWGLDSITVSEMQAYISIAELSHPERSKHSSERPEKLSNWIDINLADSSSWESLPGVGPVLASRIVRYRKRLRGFVSAEQLREVYGVTDTLMRLLEKKLRHGERMMRRDLMLASEEELKSHPYIGYKMARLIVRYREQHPDVNQWEAWKRLPGVNDSVLLRWKCYFRMEGEGL
jgi:competence protein ComEA